MSDDVPKPIDDSLGASSLAQPAGRTSGVRRPPLRVDLSTVPDPTWLKHSVYLIDIAGGVLSAIVVAWMGGHLIELIGLATNTQLSYWMTVAAIGIIGWLIRRRVWAVTFLVASGAIPLGVFKPFV